MTDCNTFLINEGVAYVIVSLNFHTSIPKRSNETQHLGAQMLLLHKTKELDQALGALPV